MAQQLTLNYAKGDDYLTQETLGSLELNRIYRMDAIEGMRLLPDDSVDLMRKAFGVQNQLGEQLRCGL